MKAKRIIGVLVFVAVIFLVIWGASLLKCEILSNKYGGELFDAYKGLQYFEYWLDGYSEAKVISCDADKGEARVYYVVKDGERRSGILVSYMKEEDGWNPVGEVQSLWATGGTADKTIWPYWYHSYWIYFG